MQSDPLNVMEFATTPPAQGKIRVVVVDDRPAMLEAICSVLQSQGSMEIVGRAQDGVAAVQAVAELGPELVIMDVRMPVMDGLQAARLLAEHFPETRVVLMSGEQLREECRAVGADAFIFKIDFIQEFGPVLRRLFPDPRLASLA